MLLGAALTLLLAAAADARPFNARLELAYAIANAYWGGPSALCTSIEKQMLPRDQLQSWEELGDATQPTTPQPCVLRIDESLGRFERFSEACQVMIHEDGHLHGLGHSEELGNPMSPFLFGEEPVCIRAMKALERLHRDRVKLSRASPGPHPRIEASIARQTARVWAPLIGS